MQHSSHRIWRNVSFVDIELQRGRSVSSHDVEPHFHDSYQFVLIEEGRRHFRYRRANEDAGSGQLTLVQPGDVHSGTCSPIFGSSFRTLHLPTKYVDAFGSGFGLALEELPFSIEDVLARKCFRDLHAALEGSIDRAELDELIFTFLESIRYLLPNRATTHAPPKQRLERARTYIRENYQKSCCLEKLASLSCLSKYHFVREFVRAYGTSPIVYRNAMRVSEARKLLTSGRSLKVVASDLGFADQSHFGRIFRSCVGFTPAAYQRFSMHLDTDR